MAFFDPYFRRYAPLTLINEAKAKTIFDKQKKVLDITARFCVEIMYLEIVPVKLMLSWLKNVLKDLNDSHELANALGDS